MNTHLWEIDHPYYATEGNYYSNDCHADYESWADFLEEQGDADLDMNLIYRWDWHPAGPDYELEQDQLCLYYIGQGKALARSVSVTVEREQEDEIRAWLAVRAEHLRLVWEPLLGAAAG